MLLGVWEVQAGMYVYVLGSKHEDYTMHHMVFLDLKLDLNSILHDFELGSIIFGSFSLSLWVTSL